MATHDSAATFKVRVNLVLVRVVVRDEHGKVVDSLHKQDFLLYDNRKPQTISTFAVETPASHTVPVTTISDSGEPAAATAANAVVIPQRFITLLFDDLHLAMDDAVNVRTAAARIFDAMMPSDRISISTTSGQFAQDFTGDGDLLRRYLNNIISSDLNTREINT